MTYRRDLWDQAAYRHGVFTLADARDIGVPEVEVRKLASRGVLTGYGSGVYVHGDVPSTRRTEFALAQALGGTTAFLCGQSVFMFHGVGDFNPKQIDVGVGKRLRRKLPLWINLQFRRDVTEADIVEVDGVRMMHSARALADVKDIIDEDRFTALCQQADFLQQQGW